MQMQCDQLDPSVDVAFKVNRKLGIARRIAAYLDHRAKTAPGVFTPYAKIADDVLGLFTRRRSGSKQTRCIQDLVYKARPILRNLYGRDLITTGEEARASTDGFEVFRHRLGQELVKLTEQLDRSLQTASVSRDLQSAAGHPAAIGLLDETEAFGLQMKEALHPLLKKWSLIALGMEDSSEGAPVQTPLELSA